MPHSGRDLGVDLYHLWLAGTDNLPSVAAEYVVARNEVASTDIGLIGAFRRHERFGGGPYGPAHAGWTALRDELRTILAETAENLDLTGEALRLAASGYARTDSAAAAELERLRRDRVSSPANPGLRRQ
jgi:hypothetical protein